MSKDKKAPDTNRLSRGLWFKLGEWIRDRNALQAQLVEQGKELEAIKDVAARLSTAQGRDVNKYSRKYYASQRQLTALREVLAEFFAAMVAYQMDGEEDPPYKHRDMMKRAESLLDGRRL